MDKELLEGIRGIVRGELEEPKQILRALEHSAEVNKSVHDSMQHDIASIMGEMGRTKK